MSVLPITSRMALSAMDFTASSWSRTVKTYFMASATRQVTLKLTSTMLLSLVSIRLSSA